MHQFFRNSRMKKGLEQTGFFPSPDVRAAENGSGLVLFHCRRGTVFTANPLGAQIWNDLRAGGTLDRIVGRIVHDSGAAETVVRADAKTFIEHLQAEGLLLTDGADA